jgi:TPR repeat protein
MYTVGLCYENGMGVEEDLNEACVWYYKANELGHVDAMFQLGWLYMFATEDNEEAFNYGVECMRAAAENDHPQAIEIMKELEKAGH